MCATRCWGCTQQLGKLLKRNFNQFLSLSVGALTARNVKRELFGDIFWNKNKDVVVDVDNITKVNFICVKPLQSTTTKKQVDADFLDALCVLTKRKY